VPDPKKARFPQDVIFFCADCNCSFGKAKNENLGLHFICPNEKKDKPPHLARIILDQRPAKKWLRWERKFLDFQTRSSPFSWLRKFWPKIEAGAYIAISTVFLLAAILIWSLLLTQQWYIRYPLSAVLLALAIWRFIDIFVTNISITFTSRFPANPIRSVLYSLVGYVQIALSFAFFYVVLGSDHFYRKVDAVRSVFYSFGTIATVGYGDLSPSTDLARLLVVFELILGLFFVAIILAQVAGWATKSRREEGDYPIEDLR
jgi:voltage-gated potassium channel